MKFLEELNPMQKEAVLHGDGPLLIIAGAGSGKTKTLAYRIAYLVKKRAVRPDEILAVTFTNKAAGEMRHRVEGLLKTPSRGLWVSTFHSCCARMLRENIGLMGYSKNFNIIDNADSVNLVKSCMKDMGVSERLFSPREMTSRISALKSKLITPDEYGGMAQPFGFDVKLSKIYPAYQERLKSSDAVDFDDLLMLMVTLLKEKKKVLKTYQDMFKYILVDEYQDTNPAQYSLVKLLAGKDRNICAVGDDDQSIYRFRGADLRNILDFEKDYPDAKVVKLEQNYRSTQRILDAAWHLVSKNPDRKPKKLWTELGEGEKVAYMRVNDEEAEANLVASEIKKGKDAGKPYTDFAVLYRTNTQSRTIEEALRKESIPYRVVGGMKFYDRKEIKDIISYLKVICNPKDSVSLKRIVNTPPRGIGEATLKKAALLSQPGNVTLMECLELLLDDETLATGPKKSIAALLDLFKGFAAAKKKLSPAKLAEKVMADIKYTLYIRESMDIEAQGKVDNIKELLSSLGDFEKAEGATIEDYLTQVSLIADWDRHCDPPSAVTLMTLHLSKGLEFNNVFITGLEEGLIPHAHSNSDDAELEEERRLLYVGMTRAKERLYLLNASTRKLAGLTQSSKPSRFLDDLPEKLIQTRKMPLSKKPIASAYPGVQITNTRRPVGVPEARYPFKTGVTVSHPLWGNGIVEKMEGRGEALKVTVCFDSVGKKKLMAKMAGLTRAQ